MLPVKIGKQSQDKFYTGQGTATGTAAAITAEPWEARDGVYIRNHDATNPMYVGPSGVTTSTGFRIDAGDSLKIEVEDPTTIYAVSGGSIAYSFLIV